MQNIAHRPECRDQYKKLEKLHLCLIHLANREISEEHVNEENVKIY